jgi:cytochrome subunit of sulfide dehydrogenase
MPTSPRMFAGAAMFAALVVSPAIAQDAPIDASVLAGSCANCHGTDGVSPGAIPSIAGQPYDVLLAQLQAFKAGEISGATIMTRIATGYSDEELEAIARYFSEIEP